MSSFTPTRELSLLKNLKLYLLANGINVRPSARQELGHRYPGPLTRDSFVTTSGIFLRLIGGVLGEKDDYAGASVSNLLSEARLSFENDTFVVTCGSLEVPVQVFPPPRYSGNTYVGQDGRTYSIADQVITHGDWLRVQPFRGCAHACSFCTISRMPFGQNDQQLLLDTARLAMVDPWTPARHGLVSGGTAKSDEDRVWVDELLVDLIGQVPIPWSVMAEPRWDSHPDFPDQSWPWWLSHIGVAEIWSNMDVYDESRAVLRMRGKHEARGGLVGFLPYLEECAELFPQAAYSIIIVGNESIEPTESTLRGVEAILRTGCRPVLSAFVVDSTTRMKNEHSVGFEEMVRVLLRARELSSKFGIPLGPECPPCQFNIMV